MFSYDFCRVLSSWISENILICAEISLCFRICPTTMQKVSDSSDEPEAQKKPVPFGIRQWGTAQPEWFRYRRILEVKE